MRDPVSIQRSYYRETADQYDSLHVHEDDAHEFALAFMMSMIDFLHFESVLDIGSGTGRALLRVKKTHGHLRICGIEPSPELRNIAYGKGLVANELIDGDAQAMTFPDGAFDLVCEFGALHHIPNPGKAVLEMLRVARKAVFISDSNNFGQGSTTAKTIKQILAAFKLWKVACLIKTYGKGYFISEGDGLAYSYSVFSNYTKLSERCKSVHILNTSQAGMNLYRSASTIALLGIK